MSHQRALLIKKLIKPTVFTVLAVISISSYSKNPVRADFDVDNDGLIEINEISDFEIVREARWNVLGRDARKGEDKNKRILKTAHYPGCPKPGCSGFELTQSLEFDTDHDGKFDDESWNGMIKEWRSIPGAVKPSPDAYNRERPAWTNVKRFYGIFEGNGHTLNNLYMKNARRPALFESTAGATIRNLMINSVNASLVHSAGNTSFKNITMEGNFEKLNHTSVLVMSAYDSSFDQVTVKGVINGGHNTALLVAKLKNSSVNQCQVMGDVTSSHSSAGLIVADAINSTISNCIVSGMVIADHRYAGAAVGSLKGGKIINVESSADSRANFQDAGGLVGYLEDATIENSSSTGNVNSPRGAGGLVAVSKNSSIINSYHSGRVEGGVVGGLASSFDNGRVVSSYSEGHVKGSRLSGGLVGDIKGGEVLGSFNLSHVSGAHILGGLVAQAEDTNITTCFNNGYVYSDNKNSQGIGGLVGVAKTTNFTSNYSMGKVSREGGSSWFSKPKALGQFVGVMENAKLKANYWWDIDGGAGQGVWIDGDTPDQINGLNELSEELLICATKKTSDSQCASEFEQFKSTLVSAQDEQIHWILKSHKNDVSKLPGLQVQNKTFRPSQAIKS